MKITEFFITGFGIFAKQRVTDLSPRLNLFVGDNEAGKSTLLAFFRAVFFGFESAQSKENPYKPVADAEHGGVVTVQTERDNGQYLIQRKPGRARGDISVAMPDGGLGGESVLSQVLLPGMTKDLYRNVFAFSLDELQGLESLGGEDVRSRIYSYGAGSGAVSAMDVERQLDRAMADIYAPRAHSKRANALIAQLDDVHDTLRKLKTTDTAYDEARRKLVQIDVELSALDQEVNGLRGKIAHLERQEQAWESWKSLREKTTQLEILPEIEAFPDDGVGRLDTCEANIKNKEAVQREKTREQETEQSKLQNLDVDQRLIDAGSAIDNLIEHRGKLVSALDDRRVRQNEASVARDSFSGALRQVGEEWDEQAIESFDASLAVLAEVRARRDGLQQCERQAAEAAARSEDARCGLEGTKEQLADAERRMAEADPPVEAERVAKVEAALQRARSALAEAEIVRVSIKYLGQREEDQNQAIERRRRDLAPAPPLPYRAGGVFLGLVLAGLAFISRSSPLMIAALAVLPAAVGELLERRSRSAERARHERVATDIQQMEETKVDIERELGNREIALRETEETLQAALASLGCESGSASDLDRLETELNAASQMLSRHAMLNEQYAADLKHWTRAQERANELRGAFEQVDAEWLGWLDNHGLRQTLTPETTLDLLRMVESARDKLREAREKEDRAKEIGDYLDSVNLGLAEVLEFCGREPVDIGGLREALSGLKEDLDRTRESASRRERHQENLDRLSGELRALDDEIRRALEGRTRLLRLGGATDVEDFRVRGRQYAERQELLRQVRQHETEIGLIAGSGMGSRLQSELEESDLASIRTDLAEKRNALNELGENQKANREEKGSLGRSIKDMEQSEQLSTAMAEESTLRAQLEQAASSWAVRAICREMLRKTRERYEREKQPRVVQQASDYFRCITSGAYEVRSPYGQEEAQVIAPGGEPKEATKLSRGTREQLYLSLRFGLIREYSSLAEPLPVVMDDILVNCDRKRCHAAAETILQLAQSNQILFFTCHPETADLFLRLNPETAQFAVQDSGIVRVAG